MENGNAHKPGTRPLWIMINKLIVYWETRCWWPAVAICLHWNNFATAVLCRQTDRNSQVTVVSGWKQVNGMKIKSRKIKREKFTSRKHVENHYPNFNKYKVIFPSRRKLHFFSRRGLALLSDRIFSEHCVVLLVSLFVLPDLKLCVLNCHSHTIWKSEYR